MTSRTQNVIRDLLRIHQKYGEAEFAKALASIRNGDAFTSLVQLGIELSSLARKREAHPREVRSPSSRPGHRSSSREALDRLIVDLTQNGDPVHKDLARILMAAAK